MPKLHVCALIDLPHVVAKVRPSHVISAIASDQMPDTPSGLAAELHLQLAVNDITAPRTGLVHPTADHINMLLDFTKGWTAETPLVVHCWAGISRSTAVAFIALCAHNEPGREPLIATALRSASPSATPNALMVQIADDVLGRRGRMVDAVSAIGVGDFGIACRPFSLPTQF
jgi:predicted protein tyrosine phosphatase